MNAFFSPAPLLRYFLGVALTVWLLGSAAFALPLWATCETQNCDAWLICKNGNGQNVPPGAGPWSCVINCNNNSFCDSGETVQYCGSDCHCGNGTCEPSAPWTENNANCPVDCYCGNGTVEAGENNCTCAADVPATTCGDGCCKWTETAQNCASDCGAPPLCGNGNVDAGETFCNCPGDVPNGVCGDGCCTAAQGETINSCYSDCGSCRDGQCTSPEILSTCPFDCHTCGDGQCTAPWENGNNCVDCQVPSCNISGPQVCRNSTSTFDCNHYFANGPFSMSNTNPNQTSQTDSITLTFPSNSQWVTAIACFNNGVQLCSTSRAIGYCGDRVTNCSEACDYGNSFPNACNPTTCERQSCTTSADCWSSLFVCTDWFCGAWYCGDGVISLGEQCEQNSDCSSYGNDYECNSCYCSPPGWWGDPICGNLQVEIWEQCDDGNAIDTDGCTNQCSTGQCNPTTTYASGTIPWWYCPEGWILQGCPGAYLCVRQFIEPIICTECGNGTKDPTEECDRSDPSDPHREACNQFCLLNYCGDGEIFTWAYTWFVWNRTSTWSTSSRPVLTFSRVISQGQWGFTTILESGELSGSYLWKTMTMINDIDGDGFDELAVWLPGHDVTWPTKYGQIMSLSFDTWGKVDTERVYFSWIALWTNTFTPMFLESISNIENSIFGPGTFPVHDEFIISVNSPLATYMDRLFALFIGKYATYVGNNTWSVILQWFDATEIKDLATIGDIDNNGVDDIAVIYKDVAQTDTELAIVLLTWNPAMHLSTQIISGIGLTWLGQGKLSALGDTDSDGIEDLMVSWYSEVTKDMVLKRLLLNSNGTLKSQSTFHTLTINNAEFSYAVYGQDVDEDGVRDIVTFRSKYTPYVFDWLLILMNANWTVKSASLLNFGASKAVWDARYFPHEALFLPDFDGDGDETIAIWSPKSFNYKGAIYTYELQAPYGHELTGGGTIEECDAWSFCDDLTTRCDANPAVCPWWPSHCQPRYINGCTPFCQLWCGDGVVDANGIDGLPNTADDEICDDGNSIENDACTNECKRPYCGDGILTDETWRTGDNGQRTGYFEMCDPATTGGSSCPNTCILTWWVNARCNYTFASATAYDAASFSELEGLPGSLCYPVWVNTVEWAHIYNASGVLITRNRTCEGMWSGANSSCSLARRSCGDGVVDTWNTANAEECDDGNVNSGDGCDATCKREQVLTTPGNVCTVGSYPQVEVGEYLPVWWLWERSNSVWPAGTACDTNTPRNMVVRDTIQCYADIQRGAPGVWWTQLVKTEVVSCGMQSTVWVGLISGALSDFAPWVSISETLGTYLFTPAQVTSWINYQNTPSYGQYQLWVKKVDMNYCALRRINSLGTVTWSVTTLSDFEDCTNNVDDNGDGVVDCADTTRCNQTIHPHCDPDRLGWWSCTSNSQCIPDTYTCNGQENYCDITNGVCIANPGNDPVIPYDACWWIVHWLYCDDSDPLAYFCRESQRQALGMIVWCYEKLITHNATHQSNQCAQLSFAPTDPCAMTGCETPPVAPGNGNNRVWPIYAQMIAPSIPVYAQMIAPSISAQPANFDWFANLLRSQAMEMNGFGLSGTLLTQLPAQFPGLSGITLTPEHLAWMDFWQTDGQWIPVANPQYIPWSGWSSGEDCLDGIDDDGDGFIDCADGECKTELTCLVWVNGNWWNEDCFDVNANGNPVDNDGDGAANITDSDCYQFYGTWYQAPTPIGPRTLWVVNYIATGAMCEAWFSVSKGYFVQQWFAFSEQANTGLDTATFTSIAGISLVAEWTAIDDSLNQIANYQGAGKQYLFDDFIDTWTIKAVNSINFTLNTKNYSFLKVPNAQIYFYDGTTPAEVLFDDDVKERLLLEGGVPGGEVSTTAVTIVLPEVGQKLTTNGSIYGNNLFISKGDIKFASSLTEWCDGSDVVEWLFVAWWTFETDTIGNKNINQDKRCKWGNLQIKGTLLGLNAWSQLAPLRRSVLNAWGSGNLLFDDSKVYKAKELFETCYLPSLLSTKANSIAAIFPKYTGPISGCSADTLWWSARETVKAGATVLLDSFLNNFVSLILQTSLTCTTNCSVPRNNFLVTMMDQGVLGSWMFLIPNAITIKRPNWSTTTISVQQNQDIEWTLLYKMQQQNKLFPSRWFQWGRYNTTTKIVTIDLTNQLDKKEMIDDLGKVVGDVRQQFMNFPSRELQSQISNENVFNADINKLNVNTLVGKLYGVFGFGFQTNFLNSLSLISCDWSLTKSWGWAKWWSFNKFICYPDMLRLRTNRTQYLDESVTRWTDIIEWSSVVILSNPTIWSDLPPGAKDFLNSLVVLPK